jgi:GntR family phosphonate transport system transcriptional regulator
VTPKPLRRGGGTPVWRRIEEALAAEIVSGTLRGRMANESALAQRFDVNRHTIRQAAKALAERGLIDVMQGRGTFVRENMIDYEMGERMRFAHSIAKARRVGQSQVTADRVLAAPPEVRHALSLAEGEQVVQVDSLDVVDGRVVGVCTQYFPLPRLEGIADTYRAQGKTHLVLAAHGIAEVRRRMSRVTARVPSAEVARLLDQTVSIPVLCVETVYEDSDGVAVEYGISLFSSVTVQVVVEP